MQMRWLLVLGCLLITACSNPGDETSQTKSSTPAQVASAVRSCCSGADISIDMKVDAKPSSSSKMLGGASQTVSKIRVKCNGK